MKRTLSSIVLVSLLLPMLFTLGSCGVSAPDSEKPLVVTTIFPPYDFARAIAGDTVELSVLVTVTDSHSFSPTAADMALIEECDLFIYSGGDGDQWAEDFLHQIDTSNKKVINLMETCTLIESDHDHAHDHHDHDHESDETAYDEHVWLDPHNAIQSVKAIKEALISIAPQMEALYQANAARYIGQLSELDASYHTTVEAAKHRTLAVADEFPYRYLCEAYGIDYTAAINGCGSASDLTAIAYDQLIETVTERGLPAVICTEYSDRSIAGTVIRECQGQEIRIIVLHSCHTLTKSAIRDGQTYLKLMQDNLRALSEALN